MLLPNDIFFIVLFIMLSYDNLAAKLLENIKTPHCGQFSGKQLHL